MRIALVAPLYESVPPKCYGGTERVVSYLTEELVRMGHSVTLFASGDSITKARLVPGCPHSLRLDRHCIDQLAYHTLMLEHVAQRAREFDLIHYHVDYLHFPLSRCLRVPHVTTLHGRLDIPDLQPLYREFHDMPIVSISDAQRQPLPGARWIGTVHHGLPGDLYRYREMPDGYLAFLGRISPEKRVDRAIEIAREVGLPIRIAAKVDKVDQDYFEKYIRPMLDDPLVEYLGEIGEGAKEAFLGGARALLFPIDWEEPFGLVVIEALACGTPVVAYRRGSTPEIVEHGVTGFLVESQAAATEAVRLVPGLSRRRCRQAFEQRFTAARMAKDYVRIYEELTSGHRLAAAG
jgi:glycosyltransferase involved in cell wall biosynthesis